MQANVLLRNKETIIKSSETVKNYCKTRQLRFNPICFIKKPSSSPIFTHNLSHLSIGQ